MAQNQERHEDHDRLDGPQKSVPFATKTSPTPCPATTTELDEIIAEPDEPPENGKIPGANADFHRSTIRSDSRQKESLLTRALMNSPDSDTFRPDIRLTTDVGRRRSINSTSTASSVELTSDGGLTSPARTTTPSPPLPSTITKHMAFLNLGPKADLQTLCSLMRQNDQGSEVSRPANRNISALTTVETLTKKRCITFACGGQKPVPKLLPKLSEAAVSTAKKTATLENSTAPQKRACAIKFACPAAIKKETQVVQSAKPAEAARRLSNQSSKSPTLVRKSRPASSPRPLQRTYPGSRRTSQSPLATKRKRPAFLTSNQNVQSSEATRFHEFASGVVEEDDWIRRDSSDNKKKLTINDTLKKENAIRQLGKEAEEEALQEEEDDEQDEDDDHQDSDGEEHDGNSDGGSDADETDGNETDNEAGFAESDEESDDDEYQFWTPGKPLILNAAGEANTYRASVHRTTSESSIDSPRRMSPPVPWSEAISQRSNPKKRPKIRPGTPDLPDSTDFVCGTLDEDRPLEDAYVSCMEVRKRERHRAIPQDIDPSFPTSDPDNDDDDNEDRIPNDSDENVWIHGKFEESDDYDRAHRRPRTRKTPLHSPKRMHSPPPLKSRLRSPAPRRLFGGTSPRRMRSPAPVRHMESPRGSPASHTISGAISFTPLGKRPGLTHTKSLPRTPNAFCKQYRAVRLAAANANLDEEETTDGYTRGAIDIVKGLERKRQHRKEKLSRKQNNRARKGGPERKPQPGKGAQRMKELALHMAGKGVGTKAKYVLSI